MSVYTSGFTHEGIPQLHVVEAVVPTIDVSPDVEALRIAMPMLQSLVTRHSVQRVYGTLPADHELAPSANYLVKPYLPNRTDPVAQGFGVWNVQVAQPGTDEFALNANVMGIPAAGGAVPEVKDRRFQPASPADHALAMSVLRFAGTQYEAYRQSQAAGRRSKRHAA